MPTLPNHIRNTILGIGGLWGRLPALMDGVRQDSDDPAPKPQSLNAGRALVYQYTNLKSLLDATQLTTAVAGTDARREQRKMWATAALYMNDRKEYSHGLAILNQAVEEWFVTANAAQSRILHVVNAVLEKGTGQHFYVACFSAKSDDLGQWRGYGDSGKGVCLGYDYADLKGGGPWFSGWVIYETTTQNLVARKILEEIIALTAPNLSGDLTQDQATLELTAKLLTEVLPLAILLMKDPSFRDEHEFRLILPEADLDRESIKYRAKENRIIPYIEMTFQGELDFEPKGFPLREIILGPASNDRLNIEAVRGMFDSNGPQTVVVNASPIPFLV